jgi:GNAT superfamily N-acetyltransferase
MSDSQLFEQVKTIYLNSFPASERQELSVFTDRFLRAESIFFIALTEENQVLAMCSLFDINTHDFVLLDYLAVAESFRDLGIGASLFQTIKNWAFDKSKKIIIEVENPLFGENRLDKARRITFYEKQGAQLLTGIRYLLPPLDGNTTEEMNLMLIEKLNANSISKSSRL